MAEDAGRMEQVREHGETAQAHLQRHSKFAARKGMGPTSERPEASTRTEEQIRGIARFDASNLTVSCKTRISLVHPSGLNLVSLSHQLLRK